MDALMVQKVNLATMVACLAIAECLSMRHIKLRERKVPTVEYADGVNLFTMHGMRRVYAKALKVLTTSSCLLLIA